MGRIEDLEKRLSTDPTSKIFAQLAEEYRRAGDLDTAISTCQKGLKHHPNYFSARVALGRALLEKGALKEASQEFETVLGQVPDNILAAKFLGHCYREQGLPEKALLKYRVARSLAPEDAELTNLVNQMEEQLEALEARAPETPAPLVEVAEPFVVERSGVDDEPDLPTTVTPPQFGPGEEQVFEFGDDGLSPGPEQAEAPPSPGVEDTVIEYTAIEYTEEMSPPPPPPQVEIPETEAAAAPASAPAIERVGEQVFDFGDAEPSSEPQEAAPSADDSAEEPPAPEVEAPGAPISSFGLETEGEQVFELGELVTDSQETIPPPVGFGREPAAAPEPSPDEDDEDDEEPAPAVEPYTEEVYELEDNELVSGPPAAPTEEARPVLPPLPPLPPMPAAIETSDVREAGEASPPEPSVAAPPVPEAPAPPVFDLSELTTEKLAPQAPPPAVPEAPSDVAAAPVAVEDHPPAEEKPGLTTATLAELYASQGHLERALGVYRNLLAARPGDPGLRERVEELERLIGRAEPSRGWPEQAPRPPTPREQAVEETIRKLEGWLAAIRES